MNPLNLDQKIEAINQYLTPKLQDRIQYQGLIDELNIIIDKWRQSPIRLTIISHSENIVKDIRILKESNLKLRSLCEVKTATLPNNLDKILRNCNLLCLVNDGTKPVSNIEKKLIGKIVRANVVSYCLILTSSSVDSNNSSLQTIQTNNLPNYLTNQEFNQITSYLLPRKCLSFKNPTEELEELREYHQFLESILEACVIKLEQKLEESTCDIVRVHLKKSKNQYFLQNKELRKILSPGETIEKIKQKNKRQCTLINKVIQNTFKTIKQEINHNKIQLTNPFMYDTMMYRIQSAIQNASVIEYQEKHQTYLSLIIKNKDYNQFIHSYIIDSCQQELDLWLAKQWETIDNDYSSGRLNELVQTINQKLDFVNILPRKKNISKIQNTFSFKIEDYVASSILEENNKTLFDYHYSQSAWFRIILVSVVVGMVFILTDKIFGFIILFVQLINLFTGRDPKKIKIRQQSKEIKRILDNKFQFLGRFIADKLVQSLFQYLEQQSQEYQQEVDFILQEAEAELETIKQKINNNRNEIEIIKQDERQIMNILQ